MENLIIETNSKLQDVIANLSEILDEYKRKLDNNAKEIENQLATVQNYRLEFFAAKEKIEKMNSDIEGFEEDYQKLVERFKDDELANILVAANKEISAKIDERKKQIAKDRVAMNDIVKKAEDVKKKLVKLNTEKKALELCLEKILDSYEFYNKSLNMIIDYTADHQDNLCACFYDETISDMLENEKNNDNFSVDELNITRDEYVIVTKDDNFAEDDLEEKDIDETEEVEEDIEVEETDIDSEDELEEPEEINEEDAQELDEEDIDIDDIYIEIASISDDEEDDDDESEEDEDDEEIEDDEDDDDDEKILIDEDLLENDNDEFVDEEVDLDKVAEIMLKEIKSTPVGEDEDGSILDDHSIEGNEHEIVLDNLPIQDVDLNDELDLENLINFTDDLEDEEEF